MLQQTSFFLFIFNSPEPTLNRADDEAVLFFREEAQMTKRSQGAIHLYKSCRAQFYLNKQSTKIHSWRKFHRLTGMLGTDKANLNCSCNKRRSML